MVALRSTTPEPNLTEISTHFNLRSQLDHLLTSANRILCDVKCRGIKYKFRNTISTVSRNAHLSNFKRHQSLHLIQTNISNEIVKNNTTIIEFYVLHCVTKWYNKL